MKYVTKYASWWGVSFFIAVNFAAILLMWYGRMYPPELDDSFSYITKISLFSNFSSSFSEQIQGISLRDEMRLEYLPWTFVLGSVAKLFSISASTMYFYNFFVGIILGGFVLRWFFLQFYSEQLTGLLLALLGLYTGHGSWHGFYWVVPSFYALLMFFVLMKQLVKPGKFWAVKVFFINMVYVILHPIAFLSLGIMAIYTVLGLITRKVNRAFVIRSFFLGSSALVLYILWQSLFYYQFGIHNHQHSVTSIVDDVKVAFQISQDTMARPELNISKNFEHVNQSEANHSQYNLKGDVNRYWFVTLYSGAVKSAINLFLVPILTVPTIFILFILGLRYSYYDNSPLKWWMWWGSSIVFLSVALLNPFGGRSLLFLWPFTFVLMGLGAYQLYLWSRLEKVTQQKYHIAFFMRKLIVFSLLLSFLSWFFVESQPVSFTLFSLVWLHMPTLIVLLFLLQRYLLRSKIQGSQFSMYMFLLLVILGSQFVMYFGTIKVAHSIYLQQSSTIDWDMELVDWIKQNVTKEQGLLYDGKVTYYTFLSLGDLLAWKKHTLAGIIADDRYIDLVAVVEQRTANQDLLNEIKYRARKKLGQSVVWEEQISNDSFRILQLVRAKE